MPIWWGKEMSMHQNILVIGATGYVGGILSRHFVSEGHKVSGLARSEAAAAQLSADAILPVIGDLTEAIDPVLAEARAADVVVYAAQVEFGREPAVLEQLCDALAETAKTLIFLSGTGVFMRRTGGGWTVDVFAEDDPFEA
jgi:uncharacterized protein YbjT (DUF2867 family)